MGKHNNSKPKGRYHEQHKGSPHEKILQVDGQLTEN